MCIALGWRPSRAWLLGILLGLLAAQPATAKPSYGSRVDDFCTSGGRTPATPYAGDCAICHNANNDGRDRTPGFDAYRAHKGDRDFSFFCPADVPNAPPILDPIGDQEVAVDGLMALRITARDPEGGNVALEVADAPTGASFQDNGDGSADFVWMPNAAQVGNHPVLFRATDDATPPAVTTETLVITVGGANRPPVLDPIGNVEVEAGERLMLVIRATDPDRDPVTFGAMGLPAAAALLDLGNGSAELSWQTSPADFGNVQVTFTVTDAGLPMQSDSETIIITVGSSNRPPMLAPIGDRRIDPGESLVLTLSALDPDGDPVRFTLEGLPAGASLLDAADGSAILRWVPLEADRGNHPLSCTVIDAGVPPASDSESFILAVGGVNRAPSVDPIGVVEDGDALVIPLVARDPDGDALHFSAVIPSGAAFVDNGDGTAEFRWTPSARQKGDYRIIFTAYDDGRPVERASVTTTLSLGAGSGSASGGSSQSNGLHCGIGFELIGILPPLMWIRRRARRGAGPR